MCSIYSPYNFSVLLLTALLIFLMAIQQMVKFFYDEGKGVDVGYLVSTSVSFSLSVKSHALSYTYIM